MSSKSKLGSSVAMETDTTILSVGFLPGIFSGGTKSIVMQISFVMLIFLLFSDQISRGGAKVSG